MSVSVSLSRCVTNNFENVRKENSQVNAILECHVFSVRVLSFCRYSFCYCCCCCWWNGMQWILLLKMLSLISFVLSECAIWFFFFWFLLVVGTVSNTLLTISTWHNLIHEGKRSFKLHVRVFLIKFHALSIIFSPRYTLLFFFYVFWLRLCFFAVVVLLVDDENVFAIDFFFFVCILIRAKRWWWWWWYQNARFRFDCVLDSSWCTKVCSTFTFDDD